MGAFTRKDLDNILAPCLDSTKATAKVFFDEAFNLPFSSLHEEIFRILDDDNIKQAVIAAPRGFGKTSICTKAYPAKRLLFREKKFIVPISATATKAIMDSENLKRELLYNSSITEVFGDLKSDHWTKDQWTTSTGTMVFPRGAKQQIRGILHGRHRPDLIIADDLEDPKSVMNEDLRAELQDWWFSDVCNSVNRARDDWKIVVIGTVLHEDSLLVKLIEDPDWYSVQLSICDDDYHSNWPDFISDEGVKQLRDAHKRRGQLDLFYREYRNMPVSTEDATFKPEYFKYYEEADIADNKRIENVILVDPAKTVKMHSAESAVVVVGIDRTSSRLYVRDVISAKMHPDTLYNEIFAAISRYNCHVVGVEVTSLNEFITQPIKNESQKRGVPFELIELKARAKKEDRIAALVPYYRQGYVYHNQTCTGGLERQLMSFPRSRLMDIMDCFAYVVELLDVGNRYFEPPDMEDPEEEFATLDQEPMVDNWRYV
ncbi:MAG: hypothetical protein HN929_02015 [Chloroflexi bacterium]|nr:hypothetical protein [Chloroflexota bacterium]